MKIYQFEKERGVEKLIQAQACDNYNGAIACSTAPIKVDQTNTSKGKEAIAKNLYKFRDEQFEKKFLSPDLMEFHAILVSTNWNKNDDVFTPDEVFPVRHTPIMKPVNMGHKGRESVGENTTIGVMFNSYAARNDEEYTPIYADEDVDGDFPDLFHLIVGSFIWEAYWPSVTASVKEGIGKNELFVSMEVLFADFGYALKREGSEQVSLLPRNEITSWLSSYLRAFGGDGKVNIEGVDYRIGRWLKDLVFSGMGIVENPGNEQSIIFQDFLSHASAEKLNYLEKSEDWGVEKENISDLNQNSVLFSDKGNNLWLL